MATVKRQRGLDAIKPYVPGKAIEDVQRQYGLTDIVKLASNENPLGISPVVHAALEAALRDVNLYPDPQAYTLRQSIARHLQVQPEQVIVGNGEDGLIRGICVAYLDEGDEVIVSRSSFPVYDISTQVMRGTLVKTPLKDMGLDLDAMLAALSPRTKLIFVCNPNNPTGTIVTATQIERFVAQVPDRVLIVLDEAYFEYVDDPRFPDSLAYVRAGRQNVIVLRSFSKGYGLAGLRLGYGVAGAELLAPLYASSESFPVNRLAQVAGAAALEDRDFLAQSVRANRAGRDYLYGEFDRLGLDYVRCQANFVLLKIGPDAAAVIQAALMQGVIVRPCTAYDLPQYARVTIGTPAQNARLIAALEVALRGVREPVPA